MTQSEFANWSIAFLPFSFIPFWLYAEIHYRFKFIPSRLFYPQPEIIVDFAVGERGESVSRRVAIRGGIHSK
jgi:hypothetical protein